MTMANDAHVRCENPDESLYCAKCDLLLVPRRVNLAYMGNRFPVELPTCPQCNMVYMPEELATGKILSVEKALEDK